jgi:pimeloyl-ACP methyl ester carboxylesterase
LTGLGLPPRYSGPRYSLPDEVYDIEQTFLPESSLAWFEESAEAPNTLAQAGSFSNLGDIPLILLASTRPPSASHGGEAMMKAWIRLQYELAGLSADSEIRLFPEAGHYLQYEEPGAVVDAIREVVGRCLSDNTD